MNKICGDCKKEKPLSEFNKRNNYNSTNTTYYRTSCKKCDIIRAVQWKVGNRDKFNKYQSAYRKRQNV